MALKYLFQDKKAIGQAELGRSGQALSNNTAQGKGISHHRFLKTPEICLFLKTSSHSINENCHITKFKTRFQKNLIEVKQT